MSADGHTDKSQHYQGRAIDWHMTDRYGKIVPLFDQFIIAIRFDWNGIGLYPAWRSPGLHTDMRIEGRLGEAALWWRDKNGEYEALKDRYRLAMFGEFNYLSETERG